MSETNRNRLTIVDGPASWVDEYLIHVTTSGEHVFDARTVGADLLGLRAVVDEYYRIGSQPLSVSMPHGEDNVGRVAFALRRSSTQSIDWIEPTFETCRPVPDWRPPFPPIETQRLTLGHPTAEQIDGFYHDIVGTNIFDTILWDGPNCPVDVHDFWLHGAQNLVLKANPPIQCALIEKSSNRYIGGCGLRILGQNYDVLDIGYALAEPYHGQGYATEAVAALVDYGFRRLGAQRICGEVFVGNRASARVLEKNGFRLEGTHRQSVKKRGQWIDAQAYAITRTDWRHGH